MPVKKGRAYRSFGGITEFWIAGLCYILTRKAGSDLCRWGWTVNLHPEGIIKPEKGGHFEIMIPEGVFFVYGNQLRQTIDTKGHRNSAYIFEKSLSLCRGV